MTRTEIEQWVTRRLNCWPEARQRHEALSAVETKTVKLGDTVWHVAFNPARSISTRANVTPQAVAARPCFLCEANRPTLQKGITWNRAANSDTYTILVNPFPVFPFHLTIALNRHEPQGVASRLADMIALARELEGYTVIYNGPHSGASAPDHCHFQAVPHEWLPINRNYPVSRLMLTDSPAAVAEGLGCALKSLPTLDGECEPRVNIAVHALDDGRVEAVIIERRAHRPRCYDTVAISPGAIDMFGTIITTSRADFDATDSALLEEVMADVAAPSREPQVRVGIMTSPTGINYRLHGPYRQEGRRFVPQSDDCWFELTDVTIGINFHWEQKRTLRFAGELELVDTNAGVTAINTLPVEQYLESVISSEMSAEASPALLRAHAVISRSWLLAQLESKRSRRHRRASTIESLSTDGAETVRWYDHDDHTLFDVCADDHCQRYQGITMSTRPDVAQAVADTRGQVIMSNGELCDTRFSKCCGGALEEFQNCWEPEPKSYLTAKRDTLPDLPLPDLRIDSEATDWINSRPDAFCARATPEVLRQVLNDYDQSTTDFYRWRIDYSQIELSELVKRRSGIDFGLITDLRPLERGTSGRIVRLEIVGTRCRHIVGKELEIRRWLSSSHLYSSAFTVNRTANGGFTLNGAGWGHGVGLCQIGAAVMGAEGYDYPSILHHYFCNASIISFY